MYIWSAKTYDFCMFAYFAFMYALFFMFATHVSFHLIPNVQIVRTFQNRIPIQTFEKWHNVSYRYVSWFMVKPHMNDIWMTYEYIQVTYRWHTSTCKWHTGDIRVHTSDIRVRYEYIRVTYDWHTSKYEWHTNGIQVHRDDLWTHRNDIWMTYKYIGVSYEWYTSGIRVHTIDIRITYILHTNDLKMTDKILNCTKDLELSDLIFKFFCGKIIALGGCKWFLSTMLFQSP